MIRKLQYVCLSLFFLLITGYGWCQSEISLKTSYEIPLGELKWIYKPNMSYLLSYSKLNEKRGKSTSVGVGIGYLSLKPKQDTFYYLLSEDEYGTAKYSNYTLIQLLGLFQWNYEVSKKAEFFWGVDAGYYYIRYEYEDKNTFVHTDGSRTEGKGAIGPKIGFTYKLSKNFGLQYLTKYNTYFSLGTTDSNSAYYNSNLGEFDFLWTNQLGVFLRF